MTLPDVVLAALALGLFALWVTTEVRRQACEGRQADDRSRFTASLTQARAALDEASAALASGEEARAEAVARAEAAEARLDERASRRERLALLTDDEVRDQLATRCHYCGGVHDRFCPRVRSLRFRPDGATPLAVEFWETWDASDVIWPEDYVAAQADALARERTPQPEPQVRVITG